MKIKIKEYIKKEKEIEITFPYYYKHDLMLDECDCVVYGKYIDDKWAYSITERNNYRGKLSYEVEYDRHDDSYYKEKYKSTKEEYENAKGRALKYINKI